MTPIFLNHRPSDLQNIIMQLFKNTTTGKVGCNRWHICKLHLFFPIFCHVWLGLSYSPVLFVSLGLLSCHFAHSSDRMPEIFTVSVDNLMIHAVLRLWAQLMDLILHNNIVITVLTHMSFNLSWHLVLNILLSKLCKQLGTIHLLLFSRWQIVWLWSEI